MRYRVALVLLLAPALHAEAPAEGRPHLEDRGGQTIPTSLFGTYFEKGQWLVYPFYEYVKNSEDEYHPSELGSVGDTDFLGESEEHEALIFLGYGLTRSLALEFEAAVWTKKTLHKAPEDPSPLPETIEESGLGDVETQLRWLWREETATRPAWYSFFEVTFPTRKSEDVLIGTDKWEGSAGIGFIRGFRWGTLNGRIAVGEIEYALEYLKRTSERWRFVATLEGEEEEVSVIGEAQWFVRPNVFVKLNMGFGITPKAPDYAPEVGVMFAF
jgi:hypothetical protein